MYIQVDWIFLFSAIFCPNKNNSWKVRFQVVSITNRIDFLITRFRHLFWRSERRLSASRPNRFWCRRWLKVWWGCPFLEAHARRHPSIKHKYWIYYLILIMIIVNKYDYQNNFVFYLWREFCDRHWQVGKDSPALEVVGQDVPTHLEKQSSVSENSFFKR